MKYACIIAVWLSASVGYYFHDGSDPWFAATIGTAIIFIFGDDIKER